MTMMMPPLPQAIGQNVSLLMPPEIAAVHDSYIERYITTRVKRVVGSIRDVPARTKAGETRICR
jgi:hypothetical protein